MANEKLFCSVCGGSFFHMLRAEQYSAGGYGSAEFRSMSAAPKSVLLCIGCSTPVTPKPSYYGKGTAADLAEQEFRQSIEVGQKHRKDNSIQNVAKIAASATELQDLKDLVSDIKKSIDTESVVVPTIKPRRSSKQEAKNVSTL